MLVTLASQRVNMYIKHYKKVLECYNVTVRIRNVNTGNDPRSLLCKETDKIGDKGKLLA